MVTKLRHSGDTADAHCNAESGVDSAMPCYRTGYDGRVHSIEEGEIDINSTKKVGLGCSDYQDSTDTRPYYKLTREQSREER